MKEYTLKNKIININSYQKLRNAIIDIKKERNTKINIKIEEKNEHIINNWFEHIILEKILTPHQLNRLIINRIKK